MHALQRALVDHDGFQCGYCTPGQICSAIAMANEIKRGVPSAVTEDVAAHNTDFSNEEIRERTSGNLCRCGAYNGIVEAARETCAHLWQIRRRHDTSFKALIGNGCTTFALSTDAAKAAHEVTKNEHEKERL